MTIFSIKELPKSLQNIVITYGHFDSIHPGHIRYLMHAKNLGGTLVVALRGDRLEKGRNRFQFSKRKGQRLLN